MPKANTTANKATVKKAEQVMENQLEIPDFNFGQPVEKQPEVNVQIIFEKGGLDKDEKDKKGKYIRKERYAGAMQRSFYVGENLTQEDIKAKYENGILRLSVPKKEAKPVETKKTIAIEG